LTIRGLRKSFGNNEALRRRSAYSGKAIVAIVGRSGCGKSTLLRLIAGSRRSTTASSASAKRCARGRRVMFQEPRLLPWARVLSNVEVGLAATVRLRMCRYARNGADRSRSRRQARAVAGVFSRADRSSASWRGPWSAIPGSGVR
jgi:ABC-type nitrate/sulfonate/bicarbonate transport system ATPase subunit